MLSYSQAKKAPLFSLWQKCHIFLAYREMFKLYCCLRDLFHESNSATATWFSPGSNFSKQVIAVISIGQLCACHHLSYPSMFLSVEFEADKHARNKKGSLNASLETNELVWATEHQAVS